MLTVQYSKNSKYILLNELKKIGYKESSFPIGIELFNTTIQNMKNVQMYDNSEHIVFWDHGKFIIKCHDIPKTKTRKVEIRKFLSKAKNPVYDDDGNQLYWTMKEQINFTLIETDYPIETEEFWN